MEKFSGFPAGELRFTSVPDLFFARLYEHGADALRIGQYVRRWVTWCVAGIAGQPLDGPHKTVRVTDSCRRSASPMPGGSLYPKPIVCFCLSVSDMSGFLAQGPDPLFDSGFRRLRGYKGMPILIRALLDYAEQIDRLDDQKEAA